MEINQLKNLLTQVRNKNLEWEEKYAKTGKKFNIFKILNSEYDEVKTHSAFIAELLNPKGSHYQKDLFLKEFLNVIGIKEFNTKTAIVETEKFIGQINNEEGGRIDLFITDEKNVILIENKIYTEDQKGQLERYYKFGKEQTKQDGEFYLLYLNLDGHEPNPSSLGKLQIEQIQIISYQNEILNWLYKAEQLPQINTLI